MDTKHTLALATATLVLAGSVFAQDTNRVETNSGGLTLFESVETPATANGRAPARNNRESRATVSEPEFTLVGISRIGNQFSAMVRHRDGETLRVKAEQGSNTPITEYPEYSIVDIQTSSVSIRFPLDNSCVEFEDRGVLCNGGANIAELRLATGQSLAVTEQPSTEEADSTPANPFEALRANAAADTGNPVGEPFTPRRIDPEDVPEGMRVIATPFGDRLVEQ